MEYNGFYLPEARVAGVRFSFPQMQCWIQVLDHLTETVIADNSSVVVLTVRRVLAVKRSVCRALIF